MCACACACVCVWVLVCVSLNNLLYFIELCAIKKWKDVLLFHCFTRKQKFALQSLSLKIYETTSGYHPSPNKAQQPGDVDSIRKGDGKTVEKLYPRLHRKKQRAYHYTHIKLQ